MNAAANFAFANRQAITAAVRDAFKRVLGVKHPNCPSGSCTTWRTTSPSSSGTR